MRSRSCFFFLINDDMALFLALPVLLFSIKIPSDNDDLALFSALSVPPFLLIIPRLSFHATGAPLAASLRYLHRLCGVPALLFSSFLDDTPLAAWHIWRSFSEHGLDWFGLDCTGVWAFWWDESLRGGLTGCRGLILVSEFFVSFIV